MPRAPAKPDKPDDLREQMRAAREGSPDALAWLLEHCRAYLLLVANEELESGLRPKVAASDLVQDSIIEAQRDFAQLRGDTSDDLVAWLRRILLHNLADARRYYQEAARRQLRGEQLLDDSNAAAVREKLLAPDTPPLERAAAVERTELLDQAVQRLPAEYRQVVTLRYREGRSFADIGTALGKSEAAAKKLWLRAVRRLRTQMKGGHADD